MTEINMPIWLFAVSAGVPCLSFLGLLLFLLRKIRKPYKQMLEEAPRQFKEDPHYSNRPFQQDLLSLQIDAAFNGLNAIIETERIKINTLLGKGIGLGTDSVQPQRHLQSHTPYQPLESTRKVESTKNDLPNIDEQIASLADSGGQPEEIADEMGLSQAEVELALKMRSTRSSTPRQRLQAVA